MELTGTRRFIHTTLFATVAWAGYLILFMWSWRGGEAIEVGESFGHGSAFVFTAGNGATVVLGFAAVVFAARAMARPSVATARRSSWLLVALVPVVGVEVLVQVLATATDMLVRVTYTPSGDAVRAGVGVIALGGITLASVVQRLATVEASQRARACGPG